MSLLIELPQEAEKRLRDRAAQAGQRPEDFARFLVETSLDLPNFDEDIARFRKAVLDAGETDAETEAFFQSLVDDVRTEQARKSG